MVVSNKSAVLLWTLLSLPAAALCVGAIQPGTDLETLLHPTGEFSARFLIIALALMPLSLLFPGNRVIAWLKRQRRAFGLAAFGYALLHTVFYVIAMGSLDDILAEIGALGIWTGWVALALFVPLAFTSSNAAVHALGARAWKRLQRLAYPAAVLTLVHWIFVHNGLAGALVHFVPLAALEIYRVVRGLSPARVAA